MTVSRFWFDRTQASWSAAKPVTAKAAIGTRTKEDLTNGTRTKARTQRAVSVRNIAAWG